MKRFCCLLLLFLLPIFGSAEEFVLEVPDIKGFTSNEITVHSPATGQLTLSVVAGTNTFFTWTADVSRGKNAIERNGLGYHNEVIPEGTYRMIALLESDHQEQTLTTETLFSVDKCKNALLFALSKSDIIYTDAGSRWICEIQLARSDGTIITEYYHYDAPSQMLGTKQNLVAMLSELVVDAASSITDQLTKLREKLIVVCYQSKAIVRRKDKRTATIQATQPTLKRYNELTQQIRQKSKTRKALVAEQKNTSKLNLIKQHDLSRQITTLTEEIEELRSKKRKPSAGSRLCR